MSFADRLPSAHLQRTCRQTAGVLSRTPALLLDEPGGDAEEIEERMPEDASVGHARSLPGGPMPAARRPGPARAGRAPDRRGGHSPPGRAQSRGQRRPARGRQSADSEHGGDDGPGPRGPGLGREAAEPGTRDSDWFPPSGWAGGGETGTEAAGWARCGGRRRRARRCGRVRGHGEEAIGRARVASVAAAAQGSA